MALTFVSEPIRPVPGSFDPAMMARGVPGVPRYFTWRKKEYAVTEVLSEWKEYGNCTHGSGERYVRKHGYRVRTADGLVLKLYCQRTFGKAKPTRARWWIQAIEQGNPPPG